MPMSPREFAKDCLRPYAAWEWPLESVVEHVCKTQCGWAGPDGWASTARWFDHEAGQAHRIPRGKIVVYNHPEMQGAFTFDTAELIAELRMGAEQLTLLGEVEAHA